MTQMPKATCPKCNFTSGNDWSQCNGKCPMPMSPHYDANFKAKYEAVAVEMARTHSRPPLHLIPVNLVRPRQHMRCGCEACCLADNAVQAPTPSWPLDLKSGRLVCNQEHPRPVNADGRWVHITAYPDPNDHSDYTQDFICPACKANWTEELPE